MGHVNFTWTANVIFRSTCHVPGVTSSVYSYKERRTERLNCKFSVRYKWFAKLMIPKIKRFFPVPSKVVRTSSSGSFHKLKYNWNFAKGYCFFSIIGASKKLAQSFSSQCSLSEELWIVEVRSVFPEKIFFSVTTRLRECHRVNLITQTTGISQKFTGLLSPAHHNI